MTKTQLRNRTNEFATAVNSHLQSIADLQDKFEAILELEDEENIEFLDNLLEKDDHFRALNNKYNELLEKIGF